jgi:hypothetical protein
MSLQTKEHNATAPQRSLAPAGWGVALMIHLAVTFLPVFSSDWVERPSWPCVELAVGSSREQVPERQLR